jgi:hypothetical protein
LFDLQADPGEMKNLATSQPEKVAELKTQFTAWLKSTQARDVTPNPAYDAAKVLFNSREAKE